MFSYSRYFYKAVPAVTWGFPFARGAIPSYCVLTGSLNKSAPTRLLPALGFCFPLMLEGKSVVLKHRDRLGCNERTASCCIWLHPQNLHVEGHDLVQDEAHLSGDLSSTLLHLQWVPEWRDCKGSFLSLWPNEYLMQRQSGSTGKMKKVTQLGSKVKAFFGVRDLGSKSLWQKRESNSIFPHIVPGCSDPRAAG